MARTPTANHGFSKASDTLDLFSFTEDHVNLLARLDAGMAGLAAYDAGGNLVNSDAGNAGKLLSAVAGGSAGRVIGPNASDDAALIYQDNTGAGTGADKAIFGYDASRDALVGSFGGVLGANGFEVTAAGNLNVLAQLEQDGARLQSFMLEVRNNVGTIEHRIVSAASKDTTADPGDVADYADKINGASNSWATMQLGLNSVTGFTAGAGAMAGSASTIAFDTAAQANFSSFRGIFQLADNSTGTALMVLPRHNNTNINGTTRLRLACKLKNATTGAAFDVSAANIPDGALLRIVFFGFLY